MLDMSQLNLLVVVESSKTLSLAAEKLQISQSAVSQMIKTIENKLDIKLFYKQGKTLQLTPKALKLVKFSKQYLKKFDEVYALLKEDNSRIIGNISLGTLFGIGKSWVGHRMIEFCSLFPDLNIEVMLEFPHVLVEKFQNQELDSLIVTKDMLPTRAKKFFLHQEKSVLVYPKSSKYNFDKDTSYDELLSHPLIFFEDNDPLFLRYMKERFGQSPKNPQARLVVNSFGQMLYAVSEKLGVAVIPTHALERSSFQNKVKILSECEIVNDEFYFAYHEHSIEQMKMKVLIEFLQNFSNEKS
ncbi:LysR family transcriptional regulator [Bacteriovoracaceae bacterium]|nr:LysR family transcriptional regulator [Bacteriovoracaceae bacterium]